MAQTNATLKQVAIEVGQWSQKPESSDIRSSGEMLEEIMQRRARREAATRASGTVLDNTKHEHFAQSVATGTSATGAYTAVGYSEAGAAASASRLLNDTNVSARIEELKTSIAEGVVEVDIRKRPARVQVLED